MSGPSLSEQLAGRVVKEFVNGSADEVILRFDDGSFLVVEKKPEYLKATLHVSEDQLRPRNGGNAPTQRQREYIEFIKMFLYRYGIAPAEADIQQHFIVSAPSVNQMIRTLERRGFITRDRDWSGHALPRSIRVIWDD
jgi:hypothetical protein